MATPPTKAPGSHAGPARSQLTVAQGPGKGHLGIGGTLMTHGTALGVNQHSLPFSLGNIA